MPTSADPARAKAKDLSCDMETKLMIAVALSHRARLLVFDEPTSGLDPVARDELVGIIGEFLLDEGYSVLFSTHITSDLDRIGDYVTLIHGGRVVRTGPKDEILEAYRVVRAGPDDLSGLVGVELSASGSYTSLLEAPRGACVRPPAAAPSVDRRRACATAGPRPAPANPSRAMRPPGMAMRTGTPSLPR